MAEHYANGADQKQGVRGAVVKLQRAQRRREGQGDRQAEILMMRDSIRAENEAATRVVKFAATRL
jgi:hypothetical protein